MALDIFKKSWLDLKGDFWGTLGRRQDGRALWLLGGGLALFLELFSWAFFQTFLRLNPCELCVYIRFSMIGIFAGAMIGALNPRNIFLKLAAYITVWWWIIQGLIWDIRLETENLRAAADPGFISLCRPADLRFPFGLKLDEWLPAHFQPLAACGQDSAWSLLGLNMSEWLFPVYGGFAVAVSLMFISWLLQLSRARQAAVGKGNAENRSGSKDRRCLRG
ncbi:MAG: disulfide bond formation protein B [Candidatus Adiutrix sp.]|jgi:disulfide bond formation protein DsbB|nr:disulfide bond formation protein B [Candidatus Adiutrix sp.]